MRETAAPWCAGRLSPTPRLSQQAKPGARHFPTLPRQRGSQQVDAARAPALPLSQRREHADGSVDVWFGPKALTGHEKNWVQTVPGRGWNVVLRLYGPEKSWFDKTWQPGEFELQN